MENSKVNKTIILVRAMWWLFVVPQKRKFAKIWATYKFGGVKLCWHRAVEKFGRQKCRYDYKDNQLSQVQSNYIISMCSSKPLFSIIVPVYKVNKKWLEKCISSVVTQHYDNWELILVDDASRKDNLRQLMNFWVSKDKRIRAYFLEQNLGIAGATNFGIKQAKGRFIGFLDHDDEVTSDALTWIVWTLNKHLDALWFYSDEDKISEDGYCHSPCFKPDFSAEFLLSFMYTGDMSIYSAAVLSKVSGFTEMLDLDVYHDIALRLSEIVPSAEIVHIPRVLYHRRQYKFGNNRKRCSKSESETGCKTVREALNRRKLKGMVVSHELYPKLCRIALEPVQFPKVSILIPTRNCLELLRKCILSIRSHTRYVNYEIVVIDNMSDDPALHQYMRHEQAGNNLNVIRYEKPFNHSDMNNMAINSVHTNWVVLMNNDVEILSDRWLEQLVATAQIDDSIAAIGGLLLYPNGTVQHSGILLGIRSVAGHAHKYMDPQDYGYFGRLQALQEYSGITSALSLIRKSAFVQVGGFNSVRYPTSFNDVDLCIRLKQHGFRCIYNPMVRATHHELKSRPITKDELVFRQRLAEDYYRILNNDPFYNPNLSLSNEQFHGFRAFPVEEQIPELANMPEELS